MAWREATWHSARVIESGPRPTRDEAIAAAGKVIGQWIASLSLDEYARIFGRSSR